MFGYLGLDVNELIVCCGGKIIILQFAALLSFITLLVAKWYVTCIQIFELEERKQQVGHTRSSSGAAGVSLFEFYHFSLG